ncbi:MAG: HAD-IIB family hydrolase [Thermodesulfobacteriota bacterium]
MIFFDDFPDHEKKKIRYVLTDIDDTLTLSGRLPSKSLAAMERLQENGIQVVPITGRPAGWCDHMARMWPIEAIVGENGAFYFRYDPLKKKMIRRYWKDERERYQDKEKLDALKLQILKQVPKCRISADQAYREADLAIDFCEDVPPLPMEMVDEIIRCFEEAGARAKISSIHVNGWFGDYDKLAMTRVLFEEVFGKKLDLLKSEILFAGDSPNDAPMFAFFPVSVGMSNILRFGERVFALPAWVTRHEGGLGFAEMVDILLSGR